MLLTTSPGLEILLRRPLILQTFERHYIFGQSVCLHLSPSPFLPVCALLKCELWFLTSFARYQPDSGRACVSLRSCAFSWHVGGRTEWLTSRRGAPRPRHVAGDRHYTPELEWLWTSSLLMEEINGDGPIYQRFCTAQNPAYLKVIGRK